MPTLSRNGITLSYDVTGEGPLLVLVMGSGSPGRVWALHQVPAFAAAGFRVATFDNRGIGGSEAGSAPYTIDDMVADTAALIEHLGAPAAVVGTSLGARVAQELALARPDVVSVAVLCAAHARMTPALVALNEGEIALAEEGRRLPDRYAAAVTALLNLSPATLADETAVTDWIDVFEFAATAGDGDVRQRHLERRFDRREAYRAVRVPCHVLAYADDRLIEPFLSREVAAAIPGCGYSELPDAGHFGYLERPEEFNETVLGILRPHTRP